MWLDGAGHSLTSRLAIAAMAGYGLAWPRGCDRWLPVRLPEISLAMLTSRRSGPSWAGSARAGRRSRPLSSHTRGLRAGTQLVVRGLADPGRTLLGAPGPGLCGGRRVFPLQRGGYPLLRVPLGRGNLCPRGFSGGRGLLFGGGLRRQRLRGLGFGVFSAALEGGAGRYGACPGGPAFQWSRSPTPCRRDFCVTCIS